MKTVSTPKCLLLLLVAVLVLLLSAVAVSEACCLGPRGNVNNDILDNNDISDLTYLVSYLFQNGPPPPCEEEADVDASGQIDVSDLTYYVAYLFQGGPAPIWCS